jgi:hypothetical protein
MKLDRPKPNIILVRGLQWTTVIERMFCAETPQLRDAWIEAIKSVAENLKRQELLLGGIQDQEMMVCGEYGSSDIQFYRHLLPQDVSQLPQAMDPAQYPWAYPSTFSFDQKQQQTENLENGYFAGAPVGQQFGGHTTVAAAGAAQQKQLQHEAAVKAAAAANAAAGASSGNAGAEAVAAVAKVEAELKKQPEALKTRSKIVSHSKLNKLKLFLSHYMTLDIGRL